MSEQTAAAGPRRRAGTIVAIVLLMVILAAVGVDGTAGTTAEGFLFPDTTDYRFFVWSGPGSESHAFTRTLSEHNEARLLHLKSL